MTDLLHDISWVVPLRNDVLTPIFEVFTALGYPNFIILSLALAYWLWSEPTATRLMVIVVLSTLLNAFLKDYWQDPRPDSMFRLDGEVGSSFGLPSGHAQVSSVFWFYLAYELRRVWAWCVASIVVIGICFSRLYLGVHDLEDVLFGASLGVISLFLYARLVALNKLYQLKLGFGLIALILLGVLLWFTWPSAKHSFNAIATIGLVISWLLGRRLFSFAVSKFEFIKPLTSKHRTELLRQAATAGLGVVLIFALLALIKSLTVGLPAEYAGLILSSAIGFQITLFAPIIFKLCKLK